MGQSRYGWGSVADIGAAIERALGEANRRFSTYMAPEPMIYAAFSQGAILARPYLEANAKRFPIVALAEGGYDYLRDPEFARQYNAAGGRRVLLLCGTAQCKTSMSRARAVLARAHLEVLVAGDLTSGHNLNAPMQQALRRAFPELVADVAEWKGFAAGRAANVPTRAQ
jgi:predicted esterase